MVGEVGLAQHEQAGQVAHEVVIHPQSAHGVVHGGVDTHGSLVRILVGDLLVHLEQVAVLLPDDVEAIAFDGLDEIQVDGTSR